MNYLEIATKYAEDDEYDLAINTLMKSKNDPKCTQFLSCMYYMKGNLKKSYKYILKASQMEGADGDVFWSLGNFLENGEGCEKDLFKAYESYEKAVEMGNTDAMNTLGCVHFENKEYDKAMEYYKKAAALDNSDAIFHIGRFYNEGYGVRKNKKKAFEQVKKAADMDNNMAIQYLGRMYEKGTGCEKDIDKALHCYKFVVENTTHEKIKEEAFRCLGDLTMQAMFEL